MPLGVLLVLYCFQHSCQLKHYVLNTLHHLVIVVVLASIVEPLSQLLLYWRRGYTAQLQVVGQKSILELAQLKLQIHVFLVHS